MINGEHKMEEKTVAKSLALCGSKDRNGKNVQIMQK